MDRTVSQTARILGADILQVKKWAWLFKEHLGGNANPAKGRPRTFADADVLALIYVAMHWEDDPDMEAIRMGLNGENHYEDRYREILYRHTPLLQEPPGDLDETWRQRQRVSGTRAKLPADRRGDSRFSPQERRTARMGLPGPVRLSAHAGTVPEGHRRDRGGNA